MWGKKTHDWGSVEVGTVLVTFFTYSGDKKVKEVKPGCGCTDVIFEDNVLTVEYTTSALPPVIVKQNKTSFMDNKSIRINYEDGTAEYLFVNAKVYEDKID